jgi:hypothetical protein
MIAGGSPISTLRSVIEDGQVELAEALRVDDRVDFHDLVTRHGEAHAPEQLPVDGLDYSPGAVDEYRSLRNGGLRDHERLGGNGFGAMEHHGSIRIRRAPIGSQHDVRVEDRDEGIEVTVVRYGEEGIDYCPLAADIEVGVVRPLRGAAWAVTGDGVTGIWSFRGPIWFMASSHRMTQGRHRGTTIARCPWSKLCFVQVVSTEFSSQGGHADAATDRTAEASGSGRQPGADRTRPLSWGIVAIVALGAVLALALLVTLALRARRLLTVLMVLTALVQGLDAVTAMVTGRFGLAPVDAVLAATFFAVAVRVSGQRIWRAQAWRALAGETPQPVPAPVRQGEESAASR